MTPKKEQTKNVKLLGGPMGGRIITVPRDSEHYRVGKVPSWTYSYAGRDPQRQEMFVIHPRSRREKAYVTWYVSKHGKDPRVEADALKRAPVRGTLRKAHGRGAAKRRAQA